MTDTNPNANSSPIRKGPWRITFDTNPDTCNLSCIMCEGFSPYSKVSAKRQAQKLPGRIMPFDLIEKIVAEGVTLGLKEIIPSTMGEPLLYRKFDSIIDLCKRFSIKLNLTTNGTFPRLGVESWSNKLVPVTSDIKISWNGSKKSTHEVIMLHSQWDDVLHNVKKLISIRNQIAKNGGNYCRITFQLTFLEKNVKEIPDIVKLAIRLGVDRVKGHHLWAHFAEISNQSLRRNAEAMERWNEAVIKSKEIQENHKLPNGKSILLENFFEIYEGEDNSLVPDGKCPFLGQEAWVNTQGRFDPCCAPDELRQTLGSFGNFNQQSLEDIWQSEKYNELVKNYSNNSLCETCNMRTK